jgi:hypothetical protein
VAEYLKGVWSGRAHIVVLTNFQDVFAGSGLMLEPHSKIMYDILAHYTACRPNAFTTQWCDICRTAGVPDELELSFPWAIQNQRLVSRLRALAQGKPIVMLNGGRPPMGRTDGYSDDMLPNRWAFDTVLSMLSDCFVVKVGKGIELYKLGCDLDLSNETTSADLLDVAMVSAALVGQCSYMVPLAECFDKPFLGVWAEKGLRSATPFIRQCTPQKILSKPATDRYIVDNWPVQAIADAVADLKTIFKPLCVS